MSLANLKRRRGAIQACITKITTKIGDLEGRDADPSISTQAQQLSKRLETLDDDFKTRHFAVIDEIEDEEQLATEQGILDNHDDVMASLGLRLQTLMALSSPAPPSIPSTTGGTHSLPNRDILSRRSTQLQARLVSIHGRIDELKEDGSEAHLICLYQEHLADLKRELSDLRNDVLVLTADTSDPLMSSTQKQEDNLFEMAIKVKKLAFLTPPMGSTTSAATSDPNAVKLPKIDVPKFDGELLHWQTFWEQFSVSVDRRSDITNTEKLVYLRHSLKEGTAKYVIEGLSHSGDQYAEAVESLKARYDRPRIIHQAHVRKICEVPNLKDGSGRELRRFHDTVQQHLRALKAMDEDPTGSFITAMLELKLDKDTMFEWQKASLDAKSTPHYGDLLRFLSLRAQASETCTGEPKKHPSTRKPIPKSATSFASSTSEDAPNCLLCKTQKHPLYACSQFKALPHDKMLSTVRSSNVCLNCLKPGHFSKNCTSNNQCRKCQKPHHTLLHIDSKSPADKQSQSGGNTAETTESSAVAVAPTVSSCTQSGRSGNTLLMTCQMLVHAPDGSKIQARGLLDSGSSTSFVSDRLAQSLGLPLSTQHIRIMGITGMSRNSPLQSIATFSISPILSSTETMQISAIVVPRVTCDLPTQPINFSTKWSHLNDLHLADPNFGQPSKIDILLGANIYADVLLHGRRSGPPGTPVAFETKFGWVLTGKTSDLTLSPAVASHHVATLSGDDILRKFWEIEESPKSSSNYSPEENAVVRHFAETHKRSDTAIKPGVSKSCQACILCSLHAVPKLVYELKLTRNHK